MHCMSNCAAHIHRQNLTGFQLWLCKSRMKSYFYFQSPYFSAYSYRQDCPFPCSINSLEHSTLILAEDSRYKCQTNNTQNFCVKYGFITEVSIRPGAVWGRKGVIETYETCCLDSFIIIVFFCLSFIFFVCRQGDGEEESQQVYKSERERSWGILRRSLMAVCIIWRWGGKGERKRELAKKLAKEKWYVERNVWMNFNAIRKL